MKLGLRLPQRLGVDLQHDLVEAARTAEAAGYASLWTYERLLFPETPARTICPAERAVAGNLAAGRRPPGGPHGSGGGDRKGAPRYRRSGRRTPHTRPAGEGAGHDRSDQRRPHDRRYGHRLVHRRTPGHRRHPSGSRPLPRRDAGRLRCRVGAGPGDLPESSRSHRQRLGPAQARFENPRDAGRRWQQPGPQHQFQGRAAHRQTRRRLAAATHHTRAGRSRRTARKLGPYPGNGF